MEIFDTNIKQMLLQNEALKQHILDSFCDSPAYGNLRGLRDNNFNADTLFKTISTSSVDYDAFKYIPAKRKDSGDCYSPCLDTHEVNYHKIIIERCNRNKGVTCDLCCECCDKAEKVTNTEPPCKKDNGTVPCSVGKNHRATSCTKSKSIQHRASKHPSVAGIIYSRVPKSCNTIVIVDDAGTTDTATTTSKDEKPSKEHKKPKKTPSDTIDTSKLCIPAILEEADSSLESDEKFGRCKKKKTCGCQTYPVDKSVAKLIKGPPVKTVCMPKKKKKVPSSTDVKSTESSSCSCDKKKPKCFCFRKKQNKCISTNIEIEKCIQTTGICCSDKCEQITQNEAGENSSSRDSNEYGDQVKIKPCSKCGKCSHKCCKSVVQPNSSSSPLSSDQTDTLKTLIKIEAKQNYRQVNIILRELNEQKTEIKKLIELYHSLSKNVSGSKLDKNSVQGFMKKMDYLDDFPCSQRTQTVNICEGCGLHFYRDGLVDTVKKGGIPTPPLETEKVETDEQPRSTSEPPSTTEPKSTSEHKSSSEVESDKHFKTATLKTSKVKPPSKIKMSKEKFKPETVKDKVQKKDDIPTEPKSPTPPMEEKAETEEQEKPETPHNTSVLTLYKEEKASETSIEKETPKKKSVTLDVDFKTDASSDNKFSTCKSKSKAFLSWCKKSFVSVKDKESKQLKHCNKFIQSKIKKCKQSCTERPKKTVFTYVLQYCLINDCDEVEDN